MIDKSIPYKNIIMKYFSNNLTCYHKLPSGYYFSNYLDGDEAFWACMEVDNNDFDTYENAINYFLEKYLNEKALLIERFVGVRNSYNKLVGAVICWYDKKNEIVVSCVHWLVVDPKEQRKGIGKCLMEEFIRRFANEKYMPIYLHTQPWSYNAIGIYYDVGFRITKNDTFKDYENQYDEARKILKNYMSKEKYKLVINDVI